MEKLFVFVVSGMGQNPSSIPNQSAVNFCVYFNRAIPQAGEFSFCPWCGSKLMNQMHQEIEFSDIQCSFKDKDLIGSGTYAKVQQKKKKRKKKHRVISFL